MALDALDYGASWNKVIYGAGMLILQRVSQGLSEKDLLFVTVWNILIWKFHLTQLKVSEQSLWVSCYKPDQSSFLLVTSWRYMYMSLFAVCMILEPVFYFLHK